jgi:long-chain acyl-CoA synthetase
LSIHWPIFRNLVAHPRRVWIVDDLRRYRGVDLLVGALHLAAEIDRRSSTSTLGVMLPTGGAFPMGLLAGWMLGKTVIPLNYLLKPDELQYVIDDCGTDVILTAGPMLTALGRRPRVRNLVEIDTLSFKGFPEPRWPALAGEDDLALLLYTSGTSGRPKGVMLTHGNITSNIRQIVNWVEFGPQDVLAGVLPQFHTFGLTVLTLLPLSIGCRVVYTARFVPHRIVKMLREHRPSVLVAIPSMYNALLHVKDAGPDDFRSIRYLVSGGEPLPEAVFDGFRERFKATINEGYGLTETSPVTNWCRPSEWRPHTVGRALPGIDQRIADLNSREILGPDHDGEVIMRGPNVMQGYYNLPEETAAAFDDHGYFKTGDIGRIDAEGFLYITGRLKEMIIVGGENVFPREIEEALNTHPAVGASGVIGIVDPIRGELPVAFVELKEGQQADEKSLLAWARERLAGYKVPRSVFIVPALPRNPTGKIVRRELKSLLPADEVKR